MNIVVLDGYTLNPGDLSWESLATLGNLRVHDRTFNDEILDRCQGADIILTNKTPLNADIIARLGKVQYIGVLATGYNVVDIQASLAHNITVTNIPAYGSSSVAQHTFALLLALTNHVNLHAESVENGDWTNQSDFCYTLSSLINLENKTFGIIGYGNIGRSVAKIAQAFGMKVLIYSRTARETETGSLVDLDQLLMKSDVISLHCALNTDNLGFVNKSFLNKMKSTAFLINTSRGPLINETDLADALNKGTIAGAGLDVLSQEPPIAESPLIATKNCIVTPHIAWATKEARQKLLNIAISNIVAFKSGNPINVIS